MMTLTKEDLAAIEGLFTGKFNEMNDHFGTIDKRLDGIDKRLDGIDKRLDGIDERLDGIDERLDGIDERLDGIDERLDGIDQRLDSLEEKVTEMDLRLEHVESDVASLKVGQLQLGNKIKELSAKVDETYQLALDNWGQIEESKTRLTLLES